MYLLCAGSNNAGSRLYSIPLVYRHYIRLARENLSGQHAVYFLVAIGKALFGGGKQGGVIII